MSIFSAIGNFFASIWNSIAMKKFKDFAIEVFKAETPIILGQLSSIAKQAVAGLTLSSLTNADRRAQAFKQISDVVKTQGIAAGESDINLAIEMAVKALKNNTGNAGVVTTNP